jgi:hypothetical protein
MEFIKTKNKTNKKQKIKQIKTKNKTLMTKNKK